ncbi:MAG: ATP-dependent Clp protease adaptor ClpS [Muribaculaceae bacterium]|nr:ATP-dependent Clp protease adaptor ClpS [Muribaculaceae bacterium]
MAQTDNSRQHGTSMKQRTRIDQPKRYKVILHNDDFTTMEFVTEVLVRIFGKQRSEALALMLYVHNQGSAVAGVYTYDEAMSRAQRATSLARSQGFPLRITCEPE